MSSLPDPGAKACTHCGEMKPFSEFYAKTGRVNQYLSRCKVCHKKLSCERLKRLYAEDPEPFKKAALEYYATNGDAIRAKKRADDKANRDVLRERERAYRAANPELFKAKKDRYRKRRPHVIAAWNRADYAANREAYLAYRKAWREANPEAFRAISVRVKHNRRAREAETVCDLTADQWREIVESQDGKCLRCGRPFTDEMPPTRDHVVPVSKGGGLTRSNIVALCRSCNSSKGARIADYRSPRSDQLSLF